SERVTGPATGDRGVQTPAVGACGPRSIRRARRGLVSLLDRVEEVLRDVLPLGNAHGVDTVEACPAEVVHGHSRGLHQAFQADVAQRVGPQRAGDLLDAQAVGDEL